MVYIGKKKKAMVALLSPLPFYAVGQWEAAQLSRGRLQEISPIASYFSGDSYSAQITGV